MRNEEAMPTSFRAMLTGVRSPPNTADSQPQNVCGDCAAYKTPFCTFARFAGVIKKTDVACADFYSDRHILRRKLKKPTVVMQRLGNR